MIKDETIELARKAGFRVGPSRDGPDDVWGVGANLQRFAKLLAEKEREAIWNILFEYAGRDDLTSEEESLLKHLADLIRARGQE
jgi:hypothetical protein